MDEKDLYNGENQPLTLTDKTQVNNSEQINININLSNENNITYKLPPKNPINIELDFKNLDNKITDKENEILNINKEYLESKLWYWKIDNNFKFELPPTIFKEKKVINYEKKIHKKNIESNLVKGGIHN